MLSKIEYISPKVVLSTTVLPLDGVYSVQTVDINEVDLKGAVHYIGHPATKEIAESMGAVPAESKLFPGLKPGQIALALSIKQGRSTRKDVGHTEAHQEVCLDDLDARIIFRMDGQLCPFCGGDLLSSQFCPGCGAR